MLSFDVLNLTDSKVHIPSQPARHLSYARLNMSKKEILPIIAACAVKIGTHDYDQA